MAESGKGVDAVTTPTNPAPPLTGEVLAPQAVDLDALARKINLEHKAIMDAAKGVVLRVIAAGEALITAQEAVEDGGWLRWLATTSVNERTAQLWMQIARWKRQLEAEANWRPATVADQTLNAVIRSMRAASNKKKKKKKPPPKGEEPPKSVELGAVEPSAKAETPTLDDYIQNVGEDEVFRVLREHYDAEQLGKLADLIHAYLTSASG
jgi:hypothetical protein